MTGLLQPPRLPDDTTTTVLDSSHAESSNSGRQWHPPQTAHPDDGRRRSRRNRSHKKTTFQDANNNSTNIGGSQASNRQSEDNPNPQRDRPRRRGKANNRGGDKSHEHQIRSHLSNENAESSQVPSEKQTHNSNRRRAPKISKPAGPSNHDDVRSAISQELTSSTYECMICFEIVKIWNPVWSCGNCWAVFHLKCMQKWAKKSIHELSQSQRNQEGSFWRCPGCQNKAADIPTQYRCFCKKVLDPAVNRYVTPHSCGETCNQSRLNGCPHLCTLLCHPGPHPSCAAMGPITQCFCGKEKYQRRCSETDYSAIHGAQSCGQICGKELKCQRHKCQRTCHSGDCGACQVTERRRCYCGRHSKEMNCGEGTEKLSTLKKIEGEETWTEEWMGFYSCDEPCSRPFACGIHKCLRTCHSLHAESEVCSFDPKKVDRCPCGQSRISPGQRKSCTDPIPTCEDNCTKTRPCGHRCIAKCHTGDCGACTEIVKITCRCGSSTINIQCSERLAQIDQRYHHDGVEEETETRNSDVFLCNRVCHALRTCRKHECGIRCCPMAAMAQQKQKKRRGQPLSDALTSGFAEDQVDIFHLCKLTCGKLLACKKHQCQALCHSGSCGTCMNASFDELSCTCGQTIMYPPIPCGARPPLCRFHCQRPRPCEHPMPPHTCHPDEEPCPPCPYLVEKTCSCGKSKVKNVRCSQQNISCGQVCGELLSCGGHTCQRICHPRGRCPECNQRCLKPRSFCGHACQEQCHAPFPCPEDPVHPCQARVKTSCACGTLSQTVVCMTTNANAHSESHGVLPCTTACEIANRNARLAEALEVDPNHREKGEGLGVHEWDLEFVDMHVNFSPDWIKSIEEILDDVVTKADKLDTKRSYLFPPMKPKNREFIKRLAEEYGLLAELVDNEPKRAVFVSTRRSLSRIPVPSYTRAVALRPKLEARAAALAAQELVEAEASEASSIVSLRKMHYQPVNAIFLQSVTVGVTQNDLEKRLKELLSSLTVEDAKPNSITVRWHQDEDAIVIPEFDGHLSPEDVERYILDTFKPTISASRIAISIDGSSKVSDMPLASVIKGCWITRDGKVAYKEIKDASGNETAADSSAPVRCDWASKAATPKPTLPNLNNSFSPLQSGWTRDVQRKKLILTKKNSTIRKEDSMTIIQTEKEIPQSWDEVLDDKEDVQANEPAVV